MMPLFRSQDTYKQSHVFYIFLRLYTHLIQFQNPQHRAGAFASKYYSTIAA
ncbi:unnamed protein product [Prunus brigantina]